MLILSCAANGQQDKLDNKKIDELISIIQSSRLARKQQILVRNPADWLAVTNAGERRLEDGWSFSFREGAAAVSLFSTLCSFLASG
jgi:hypothetical protein